VRHPKLIEDEHIYLQASTNLHTLYTRLMELDKKLESGEITTSLSKTWRIAYAFLFSYQNISNINRRLQMDSLTKHIDTLKSVDSKSDTGM